MSGRAPVSTVVVTGASSGIGEACARHLAARGCRVLAGVRREEDAARLREGGAGGLLPVQLDVGSAQDCRRLAAQAAELAGGANVLGLVNNAGIVVAGPLECLPLEDLRRQFETNVFGLLGVTQALLPVLRQTRGRIVNIGSVAGRITSPFLGAYSASKFALEALSDALRLELAQAGIAVSLIEPGPVATAMWEKLWADNPQLRGGAQECAQHYAAALRTFEATAGRQPAGAVSPHAVARAVEHALIDGRPRPRYPLGRGTRTQIVLSRLLGDRLRDRLTLRRLGLRS